MRTTPDRIRHALSFEIIGLMVVTPMGAWGFGIPIHDIGVVALISATIATLWNYAYNLMFDHTMLRLLGRLRKTILNRVIHAVLFEVGLLAILLPFIVWYLEISFRAAFLMDVSFSAFYLVYAFIFNWAYDLIFPLAEQN